LITRFTSSTLNLSNGKFGHVDLVCCLNLLVATHKFIRTLSSFFILVQTTNTRKSPLNSKLNCGLMCCLIKTMSFKDVLQVPIMSSVHVQVEATCG
jgi:hypothetical protein